MDNLIPLQGYEDNYLISPSGFIYSLSSLSIKHSRRDKNGYLLVNLYKNGVSKTYKLHRLVAEAFIPNLENKPQVNHKNGIKDDNRVENLEWVTNQENCQHSWNIGLREEQREIARTTASKVGEVYGYITGSIIKERKQKIFKWVNDTLDIIFTGNACELSRQFPEQGLHRGNLQKLYKKKIKSYKGWRIEN